MTATTMSNHGGAPPSWEEFVKSNLLSSGVVSGVCLTSQHALPVYSYGELDNLLQAELKQFLPMFRATSSDDQESFVISKESGRKTEFKVYKKTFCSIYATSPGNLEGLVVSNLPHGLLLCSYRHPIQSGAAVKHIEHFCDLLRA